MSYDFDMNGFGDAPDPRGAAKDVADRRPRHAGGNNGEKNQPGPRPTSFHKGLPHCVNGLPDEHAFKTFLRALTGFDYAPNVNAEFNVPLGPENAVGAWRDGMAHRPAVKAVDVFFSETAPGTPPNVRNWESPLAGLQGVLQGPQPMEIAQAPAPRLGGSELTAEMAEVYAMALLRDVSFEEMKDPATPAAGGITVGEIVAELGALPWFDLGADVVDEGTLHEYRRRDARLRDPETPNEPAHPVLDTQNLFRGSAPGAKDGPQISQFMLIGNVGRGNPADRAPGADGTPVADSPADGFINFGVQRVDQRVNVHLEGRDHMTDWALWLDVQNGADVRGTDAYMNEGSGAILPRFMGTPRDLATYVHFDQLYQAYFNACLLMLESGVPFDLGFPSGSSHATRGSFATWGGPHVLSLVTEVATRGLKAVRFQKFQEHLRGRPEQLAAMITLAANGKADLLGTSRMGFETMVAELEHKAPKIMHAISTHNGAQNAARAGDASIFPRVGGTGSHTLPDISAKNYLLPMAFPEGSPMHAAYGAGHATVAGACVTVLKAFFEMSDGSPGEPGVGRPLTLERAKTDETLWTRKTMAGFGLDNVYVADDANQRLSLKPSDHYTPADITMEGELNKLAANVSIGRNFAGVHFYTDYYDSLRLGERIAIGIMQEQLATYRDCITMRMTSFDGDRIILVGDGQGGAEIHVRPVGQRHWIAVSDPWWNRHAGGEFGVA
ncbi:hypothetical protein [Pontivivens ytuae]|uniref:Uncharacterized protein n=1 Tax=Pontivivens ytuae TaxID=2789856 RepID=A0A7S9LNE3_9RHOB|nr:hypothetical protein [Pontivivens ytuae]QPH52294.1 hypothetical protein I0K15_10670 [Pontivivens ytuae]